jgi:hypothetical protein
MTPADRAASQNARPPYDRVRAKADAAKVQLVTFAHAVAAQLPPAQRRVVTRRLRRALAEIERAVADTYGVPLEVA